MLPNDFNDDLQQDFTVVTQPTLTYHLNFNGVQSGGKVNGIEAMKQAIFLVLQTERFEYAIYSWNYGVELRRLLGEAVTPYLQAQIAHVIEAALLVDDRILEVDQFSFQKSGKGLTVCFTVHTTMGEINSQYMFNGGAVA